MDLDTFRDTVEYTLGAVNDELNSMGYDPVPPQLVESLVSLETGGTFDPNLKTEIQPGSGTYAVGLGQITTDGMEYGHYQANVDPSITPDQLTDPETNLRVTMHGLAMRKEIGERNREAGEDGAWSDWLMAAAGYFGGANNSGFNTDSDRFGTTGQSYARTIRNYIARVWGAGAVEDIDALGAGSVTAAGGDWENGALEWIPGTPEADRAGQIAALTDLFDSYGSGQLDPQDEGRDNSIEGQVRRAVVGALGPLVELVRDYAPRAGIALAGIAAACMGAYVLVRGAD